MTQPGVSGRGINWYRWGAVSNWMITLPAIVSPTLGAWFLGLDKLNDPFLLRIWAGIAFMWGCMFLTIARDPVRGRWLMKYAIIEKAITATAVTVAFCTEGSGVGWWCFLIILLTDHFWIFPFWLVRSRTSADDTMAPPGWATAGTADRFGARWLRLAGLVSLCFALWLFAGTDSLHLWLGARPATVPFLVHIWAGMTGLLGVAVLEVAAGDLRRHRTILKYCAAARGLIAASVAIALVRGEAAWQLAVVVLLADTVWLLPLLAIDAYWRGGPSVETSYDEALLEASKSAKNLLASG